LGDAEQQVSKKAAHSTPTTTPGIKQHSSLDRMTPPNSGKSKTKLNNKQATEKKTSSKKDGAS
jgi:hypothetical protein